MASEQSTGSKQNWHGKSMDP